MRKVLIITYYWPPSGGAGVQRWLKFVKYMRRFGWEPVVYTALDGEMPVVDESLAKDVPNDVTVIRRRIWEPYRLYKWISGRKQHERINPSFLTEKKRIGFIEKFSIWLRGNIFIPDARRFWIGPSLTFLKPYLKSKGITHIISSGPPHSMHLIALGLKVADPSLKWVADFRDPWTNIDFYEKLMLSTWADKRHHKLELEVLRKADRIISIGQTMSEEFREILKASGREEEKFEVITNGYDAEEIPPADLQKDPKFSIAHIGTMVKDRNPEILWQALSELVKTQPAFASALEIKLVGKIDHFIHDRLEVYGLSKYVRHIAYLPHSEVLLEQKRSHALLLIVNNTKNAKGIITGKIFEYLASGVPVLAIGPLNGDLAQVLRETEAGLISDFTDKTGAMNHVLRLFSGQQLNVNQEAVKRYSREELARRLCVMLDSL